MQVSVENTSALERRLTVSVPSTDVDAQVEAKLQQTAKTVRIDGFRPGKVPMKIVRKRYEGAVRQDVLGQAIEQAFYQAVAQENLRPVGQPNIEPVNMEAGKDLEFVATFEVFPEVELADLSGVEVEQAESKVMAADVKKMIENLREQKKEWKESPRAAVKEGDRVTIDFLGKVDGEAFDGGAAEGQTLEIGSGQMIPGFEDGIVGMKKGEEKDIDVIFPEEYHAENLKGKAAVFTITLHKVERGSLPKVDEDFVKSFGVEDGDLDKFKEELKLNMQRELDQAITNRNKKAAFDALLEANEIDVPAAAIDGEIAQLQQQAAQRFGQGQIDASQLPREPFEEEAGRRVKLGVLVGEFARQNELKADADRVRAAVDRIASAYEDGSQVVEYYYGNEDALRQVETMVLEEMTAETICKQAKVSQSKLSYEEAVSGQAQA